MNKIKLLLLLTAICFNGWAQEIVQWRGPARNGIYPESGLLKAWPAEGPTLLWQFDQLGPGHGSAAVTGDAVYVAGTDSEEGFVVALDHQGKLLWKKQYGPEWIEGYPGVRTTPLINDDRLYIMSGLGVVYCLATADGRLIWQVDMINQLDGRNITWGMTENMALDGELLYLTVGGETFNVVAVNKDDGQIKWKNEGMGEKSAYCSPAVINHLGRKIFITQTEKYIMGFDAGRGQLLWSHDQPNKYSVHANTPLYHEGQLYIVSGYGKGGVMLQLSEAGDSVTELWRDENLDNRFGGVVLVDGRLWGAGDVSRKWVCLDWKTGQELFNSTFIKKGNIIFADGMLYCYGEDGQVALVNPSPTEGYNVISTFKITEGSDQHWAHLVIHNKVLYVRHGNTLMAYDIAEKS